MNNAIADALGINTDGGEGIVIFYSADRRSKTITETGRTNVLPLAQAFDVYAETPNPASQLLEWKSEQQKEQVLARHEADIKDPKWLDMLFDSI